MKKLMLLLITIMGLHGCSSSYTDGAEGAYFITEKGDIFYLKHRFGDLYTPIKVDSEKIEIMLKKIEELK